MTLEAAEILGLSDRLGSIAPGKIANLVVTDGDIFNEKTKVKHVFVDGRWYQNPRAEKPPAGKIGRKKTAEEDGADAPASGRRGWDDEARDLCLFVLLAARRATNHTRAKSRHYIHSERDDPHRHPWKYRTRLDPDSRRQNRRGRGGSESADGATVIRRRPAST